MQSINKYLSRSTAETEQIAKEFSLSLKDDSFVALYGDLGAGKTAFVRGIVNALLPDTEFEGSPTYSLVNEYVGEDKKISHFDMYRISDEDDLYSIGFYDYTEGIIITEWSENIPFALPDCRTEVHINKINECEREIEIYCLGVEE